VTSWKPATCGLAQDLRRTFQGADSAYQLRHHHSSKESRLSHQCCVLLALIMGTPSERARMSGEGPDSDGARPLSSRAKDATARHYGTNVQQDTGLIDGAAEGHVLCGHEQAGRENRCKFKLAIFVASNSFKIGHIPSKYSILTTFCL